mgnify:CR=1 FL=1
MPLSREGNISVRRMGGFIVEKLRVGILSTGNIAATMAETVSCMKEAEVYAVASRSLEKAEAFAERFQIEKAYGSYEEMAADENVDLVYVASPMSEHYENVKMLISHGRNILCEKAFALNEEQAREMLMLAEKKGVLLAEAMWVRYMPMWNTIREVLHSGIIGEPMTVTANLCYLIGNVPRLIRPELGGGALLDVGVYTLNFASMIFGNQIEKMVSTAVMTDTGVDAQNSLTLIYPGGKMAILNSSLRVLSDRQGIIYGTKGMAVVENCNNFEKLTVYGPDREILAVYDRPEQITGYEYEVLACKEAIEKGETECRQMPHKETLEIMTLMDAARRQWGMKYPMEL